MNAQVAVPIVIAVMFAGFALFGLAVIKDYRGLLSRQEARHPAGSPDRARARRATLVPAWLFLIMGTAAVIGIPISAIAHSH